MGRDEFPKNVRDAVAKRAGFLCSFPGCEASTYGPSSEAPDAVSTVGVAAHITAASLNGPRYDPSLTSKERSSVENAIWMCQQHGTLIDGDTGWFLVTTLKEWKAQAEERARQRLGLPVALIPPADKMMLALLDLSDGHALNEAFGISLAKSGAHRVFGEDGAAAVRDCLIEVARNALTHGQATGVRLSLEPYRVVLSDDGAGFDPASLHDRSGRGGKLSLEALRRQYPEILIGYERAGAHNQLVLTHVGRFSSSQAVLPCSIAVKKEDWRGSVSPPWRSEDYASCPRVYVKCPAFSSYSDLFSLGALLRSVFDELDPRITFVLPNTSVGAAQVLLTFFPRARLLRTTDPVQGSRPT